MSDLDDEYGRLTIGATGDGFSDGENDLEGDVPRAGPPTTNENNENAVGPVSKRKKLAKPREPIPRLDENR